MVSDCKNPKPRKLRLDELMVERGLVESRSLAKSLIMAGKVRSGTTILDKPGKVYPSDLPLEVESPPRFVSRGGEKLSGFLTVHPIDLHGKRILDVGASTGGFTDCCLQHGAFHATCVDVGYGQLHAKLREDPRVANFEKINARTLPDLELPFQDYDLVVMDLSFISLTKVLEPVWQRVRPNGSLIALVKPQFEAEKREVDLCKGIIRDPAIQQRTLNNIRNFATLHLPNSLEIGFITSPIRGTDGNVEFLLGLRKLSN